MHAIVFIAAGGALGALCRYLAGMFASAAFGPFFPVGTLIVNMAGCFVIGSVYAIQPSGMLSEFVLQGCCGALTTFSTFSLIIQVCSNFARTSRNNGRKLNTKLTADAASFLSVLPTTTFDTTPANALIPIST